MLVLLYVALGYVYQDAEYALRLFGFCLLPLLCIWHPKALGSWYGYGSGWVYRAGFTGDTPPIMVSIGGWMLLAMPPIVVLIWYGSG